MVLEYLPTFALKITQCSKYTIHGAYGYLKTLEGRHRVGVEKLVSAGELGPGLCTSPDIAVWLEWSC